MTSRTSKILDYLYKNPEIPLALDTETTGLNVQDKRDKCLGASVAFRHENGELYSDYWPFLHKAGKEDNIDRATAKKVRWVLEKQRRPLIFANVQFDVLSLETLGVQVGDNPFYDVLTMQNLINENWTIGRRGLDELSVYTLSDHKLAEWEWEKEFPLKKEKTSGWPNTTPKMMDGYARVDAELTYRIWEVQIQTPAWKDLPDSVWEMKQKVIRTLTELQRRGIQTDLDLVAALNEEGTSRMAEIREELGLNPASNKDMQELFINRLGLPVFKKSEKTGAPSFAAAVMPRYEELLDRMDRPEANLYKEYQGWKTATGLLLRTYLNLTSPDGRLRTEYTTHVTATGRLSSRNPNLQQISKEGSKPWNNRIKACFVAKPGYTLLSADYSQLELRLAAAYSQEPQLLEIFEEGRDVFTEMAEEMGWERFKVKTFVYSIQYGGGVNRIMSAFNIPKPEAEKLRRDFYRKYPRFRALDELCKKRVSEARKLKIWTGRYRHFEYESHSYKAMNSLLQGGAADVVERVMVYAMEHLDSEDCRMLLQVHDALVFEVKDELVEEYSVKIKEVMEKVNEICDPTGTEPLFPVRFAVEVEEW